MNIDYKNITQIRIKDGISLYRVQCLDCSYILKYFSYEPDRREIINYGILSSFNIPIMQIIAKTECCILMEDIEQSNFYRLGVDLDLSNTEVAKVIAKWYKQLHKNGKEYIANGKHKLYDESDIITRDNLEFIKAKTSTGQNPVWAELDENFDSIISAINNAEKTLTYNDFYYTNLIVAKDVSSAFMFDYNLLGQGYAYADIRNVCSSLSPIAKKAFLSEYGYFDKTEQSIDDVASVLTTLYFACKKEKFPTWANQSLMELQNGLFEKIRILINSPLNGDM